MRTIKPKKGFFVFLCLAILSISFVGSGFNSVYATDFIIEYQIDANYSPFAYEKDGQLYGFDLELGRLIFNTADYEVNYSADDWDRVYERLKSGTIDTCGLLAINEERKKNALYTIPVVRTYLAIYTQNIAPEVKLDSLGDYRIGVQRDEYTELILRDTLNIDNYLTYTSNEEGIRNLRDGKIDVLFGNQEVINYYLVKNQLTDLIISQQNNLFPTDLAYGVSKSNPQLVHYMNQRIKDLQKKGIYEELYQKYFFRPSQYYLSQQSKKQLTILGIIVSLGLAGFVFFRLNIRYLKRRIHQAVMKIDEQNEWFRVTLASIGDAVITTDTEGYVTFLNGTAERLTGFKSNDALGKDVSTIFNIINEVTGQPAEIPVNKVIEQGVTVGLANHTMLIAKGGERYSIVDSAAPILNDEQEIIGVVMVFQDVSNRQSMERELRKCAERYELVFNGVNEGLWDWDLEQDQVYFSLQCKRILGLPEQSSEDKIDSWYQRIHPDDQERVIKRLQEYLAKKTSYYKEEYRLCIEENGQYKWILTKGKAIWDERGKLIRMAGSNTDVTERKLNEEKIHYLAYHDALTGLPNRVLLKERLINALVSAQSSGEMVAVFFMDLDRFKPINDSLGHAIGDKLLQLVALRLRQVLSENSIICRWGGDEFILMLTGIREIQEAVEIAQRVLDLFKQPFAIGDQEFYTSISIGLATYPQSGEDVHSLLKNADAALYRAKEQGRNKFEIYSPQMNKKSLEQLSLENRMRKAIEKQEFVLHYQPQLNINNGKIVGTEALIRWNHPTLGFLPPSEFIYLAEETGLIILLGEWTLYSACRQNRIWQQKGFNSLKVSVNLSKRQFREKGLVDTVEKVLRETGLEPELLELEITESIAMEDKEFAVEVLKRLKQIGIKISLDDFGTGYSSLDSLKNLPIDTLKIDQAFIKDINIDRNTKVIAESIINMAQGLNLKIIAEGVETKEQFQFLKEKQCDLIQGYLFSAPVSVEDLEQLLLKYF